MSRERLTFDDDDDRYRSPKRTELTPREALDGLFGGATMGLGGTRAAELFNVVRAAIDRASPMPSVAPVYPKCRHCGGLIKDVCERCTDGGYCTPVLPMPAAPSSMPSHARPDLIKEAFALLGFIHFGGTNSEHLDALETRRTAWLAAVAHERAAPSSGAACAHVDPMVIDGQTAWCADCGGLFGMGAWRLPSSPSDHPRETEKKA